jgi:hypothetical protein
MPSFELGLRLVAAQLSQLSLLLAKAGGRRIALNRGLPFGPGDRL